jgi:F-type H+-transporting ATPase subunit b
LKNKAAEAEAAYDKALVDDAGWGEQIVATIKCGNSGGVGRPVAKKADAQIAARQPSLEATIAEIRDGAVKNVTRKCRGLPPKKVVAVIRHGRCKDDPPPPSPRG